MFKYSQFDLITKTNKKTKFIIKLLINIIIITFIFIIFLINIDTKDDVKFISSNSRRIINNLHNYTETISDFIVSNNNNDNNNNNNQIEELNELKNIRLSIDYFKELKEQEIKEREIKEQEIKEREIKEREIKEREIKKEKAINLIKSYINFNLSFHLVPSYSKINGYSENNQCLLELININNDELFNKLIKIDYENNEVSFNYLDENKEYYKNTDNIIETHIYNNYDENNRFYKYSHYIYRNFKENIIKNPLYQIIKEKLEIDYSYTEPNPTEEYNNKSKYFSESLNEFYQIYNNDYEIFHNNIYWNSTKYYENYYNDTYYLNIAKHFNSNILYQSLYNEYIINNEIIINNPNLDKYYNKLYNFYKYICYIPSMYIINENKPPIIKKYYSYSYSYTRRYTEVKPIILEELENNLNFDYMYYILNYDVYDNIFNTNYFNDWLNTGIIVYTSNNEFSSELKYINKYSYELEKNKGSRMIKHNLTANIPSYYYLINDNNFHYYYLYFYNHYFIEKVSIDFSLISNIIYDEYEYIKVILSNIANIYDLPIIPPIKFI
jgi:hypothetical protein